MTQIKIPSWLFTLILLVCSNLSFAQINDDCNNALNVGTLVSNYLNQDFDIPNANSLLGGAIPCQLTSPAPTQDRWLEFTAGVTGVCTIEYTSTTSSEDAILQVYAGTCATLSTLQCVNNNTGIAGTERAVISATSGTTYYVRVTSTVVADMQGKLTIYDGLGIDGDLCRNAPEISIGTCDFAYSIESRFFNHEGRPAGCGGFDPTANDNIDGWLFFTATATTRVTFEFISDLDAAIGVYSGTCENLTEIDCANDVSGNSLERLEFDVLTGNTYFLRMMNIEDNATLSGNVCLYQMQYQNDCSDVIGAGAVRLNLGDCNVKFNTPSSYTSSGVISSSACLDETQRDAWMSYRNTSGGSIEVRLDYASNDGNIPEIEIYEMTTDVCPTGGGDVLECLGTAGFASISTSFTAQNNRTYIIRLIEDTGDPISGSICFYEDARRAEDNFDTPSTANQYGLNTCGQFNILPTFSNSVGRLHTVLDPANPSCGSTATNDAWAWFNLAAGATINIEYDNDNNDASEAQDIALMLYKATSDITITTDGAGEDCASATTISANEIITNFDFTNTNTPNDIDGFGGCVGVANAYDGWTSYTHTDPTGNVVIHYEGTANAIVKVYTGTCGALTQFDCDNDNTLEFTATNGTTYFIRVAYPNPGTYQGSLGIFPQPTEEACVNSITEGLEQIEDYNATAGGYWVRIVNLGEANQAILGTLCVKDDIATQGDVCDVATSRMVGDCDIIFNLGADFDQTPTISSSPAATGSCAASPPARDGWIKFTATSSKTTIEYFASGENGTTIDIALAGYRGTCGNLLFIECEDSDLADRIEKLKLNTIVGLEYYVRVMNVGSGADVDGRICIYNTTERDVCDDDDLVTKQVGDCNIPFDVPTSFSNTGNELRDINITGGLPITENNGSITQFVESACDSQIGAVGGFLNLSATNPLDFSANPNSKDGWMRFIGNGDEVTLVYESTNTGSDPVIVVYTALQGVGPVNCSIGINGAGNTDNQYACTNLSEGALPQTESVSLQTNSGQLYIVRIIDLLGGGMEGELCISSGGDPFNTCTDAREVEVGDCSITLNVVEGINDCYDPAATSTNYNNASTCDDCTTGDAWATFTAPYVCDNDEVGVTNKGVTYQIDYSGATPVCTDLANVPLVYLNYNAGADNTDNTPDDFCECAENTVTPSTYYNTITVEYNNNDGTFADAADVSMVLYQTTDCNNEAAYTQIDCSDVITGEGTESVVIPNVYSVGDPTTDVPTHGTAGETYYVRVINKNTSKSAFGDLCLFYGSDIGGTDCVSAESYGDLEGEFRNLEVPGGSTEPGNSQFPSSTIPNCVLAGGSNPVSYSPQPVRADTWVSFTVPVTATYSAVTIQFANATDTGQPICNPARNAAIAVYHDNNTGNCGGVSSATLLDCANTVVAGAESLTVSIFDPSTGPHTYYIRVMNVFNEDTPGNICGRIRIFPYAPCNIGPELAVDGNFAGWPAIIRGLESNPWGAQFGGDPTVQGVTEPINDGSINTNTFDAYLYDDVHTVPFVTTNDPYPNDLDQNENDIGGVTINTGIARFATEYGFLRDRGRDNQNLPGGSTITHTNNGIEDDTRRIRAFHEDLKRAEDGVNELNPEGLYLVKQFPLTVKTDWPSFGNGYSGYAKNNNYCNNGNAGYNDEPCIEVDRDGDGSVDTQGFYGTRRTPAGIARQAFPATSDANFMIVNGSFNPSRSLFPGKVWCQTIQRNGGNVGYYVFTVWIQNMIDAGRNLDIPQVRLSICDMEDPNNLGQFPDRATGTLDPAAATMGTNGAGDILVTGSRLPGVTFAAQTPVEHMPEPPANRLRDFANVGVYGAASYCNLNTESINARLKPLGSSFIIEERPDRWLVLRCIYRAPREVSEFNICVENLSLTKNGNDIGFDDFSFRECLNADTEAFDRLLKGDPCELTDNPSALGIPLGATLMDFNGKLIGNKVFLNWLTIAEYDSDFFEVQRSTNGADFRPIGRVDAKGNGSNYSFVDANLPIGTQKLYYRLNIIDKTGISKLGPVVEVIIKGLEDFEVKLIPNPEVQGKEIEVRFNVPAGKAMLQLHDLKGQKLMQNLIDTQEGVNRYKIDSNNLKPGIYIVRIIANGKTVSKKLMIL